MSLSLRERIIETLFIALLNFLAHKEWKKEKKGEIKDCNEKFYKKISLKIIKKNIDYEIILCYCYKLLAIWHHHFSPLDNFHKLEITKVFVHIT